MESAKLRQKFFDYFRQHDHSIEASSSLVPGNDATLLFTNAGMVQFKDVFLGLDKRNYTRAATSQRCVRAGGKHNDLENVGYTARHHTFFEMLGNFSFGDYFKREAIKFAWDFLTQELKLPAEKLWVTVYKDDQESEDIWLKEMKIDATRFSRCGEKDNFWSMGDTGPCGPCTEIFYDHGADIPGGPPGSPDEELDRYIEIWNLVFMQYDRAADGKLTPLPKPSVDTGMGLERLTAVMQGVHNNYETEVFVPLINIIAQMSGVDDHTNKSLRVIADHIRSTAFLITDGVMPSNEGRGYVLRRIIRRAIRHSHKIGITDTFFYKLVAPLVEQMGEAYPELKAAQQRIETVLLQEEEQFARTLDMGMKIFETEVQKLKDKTIPGDVAFRLYDTYGFPVDLTADIARERDLQIDMPGFDKAMAEQRSKSKDANQFAGNYEQRVQLSGETAFTGYQKLADKAEVSALIADGQRVESLSAGQQGAVVLTATPFYAEGGGQVGDKGTMYFHDAVFTVHDTKKQGSHHIHHGEIESGTINVGDELTLEVDVDKRQATALNHSGTHLVHEALRQVLGEHVAQKGSLVEASRLRLDFSHPQAMTAEEIMAVEAIVNEQIRANHPVTTAVMSLDDAKQSGAMALFGEKYADDVRVLKMGDFSLEICGGTHVKYTGELGLFKIVSETGTAAGIRRIEAVTGLYAWQWLTKCEIQLQTIAAKMNAERDKVVMKVEQLLSQNRQYEKDIARLQDKLAAHSSSSLTDAAREIAGVQVLAEKLPEMESKALRGLLDQLKSKMPNAVIVLAMSQAEKVSVIVGVSKDLTAKVKAGELVNFVAQQVGGKGGGRPDMAQAGGSQPENIDSALASVFDWVADKLN